MGIITSKLYTKDIGLMTKIGLNIFTFQGRKERQYFADLCFLVQTHRFYCHKVRFEKEYNEFIVIKLDRDSLYYPNGSFNLIASFRISDLRIAEANSCVPMHGFK